MRLKLWGTRGSIPSPLRTEAIETKLEAALSAAGKLGLDLSDAAAIRTFIAGLAQPVRGTAGGDTACVEVRSAGNLLILDCGSGLRRLGTELMEQEFGRGQGLAHIFISHTHWDHMMGWPFFVPGFVPGNRLIVYGVHPDLEGRFRLQQTAPLMFPISIDQQAATVEFIPLQEGGTIRIGATRIRNVCLNHAGDSFGYRIEDDDSVLVYATDGEYKSLDHAATQPYVEFFRDADVLIFDAMFSLPESYRKEDWGHSSAIAGADLATRAGVRNLLLFHHDPYATDEEIWSLRDIAEAYRRQHPERPPCKVTVAYDGLEMELWREAKIEAHREHRSDGVILRLTGRLVEQTAADALRMIEESATQARDQPLVLDLQGVVHIDAAGLDALFSARRRWYPLALSGVNAELHRVFARVGALDHLAIFDHPNAALGAVKQGRYVRPGRLLAGRYQVAERLGQTPLGDLYHAFDRAGQRQVDVLVLCPSLGARVRAGLIEAARAVTELRHPRIADLYQVGEESTITYLVYEHTSGPSLWQLLHSAPASRDAGAPSSSPPRASHQNSLPRPVTPAVAVGIAAQIAQALEYMHGQDIVHAALSPQRIILQNDHSIRITGIGLGGLKMGSMLNGVPVYPGPLDYLAPEQLQGGHGAGSDLYALGGILYEALTGQPPFDSQADDRDLIGLKLVQQPVPPRRRNPNISRSLEYLVLKLLHRSPQARPANATAVYRTLAQLSPRNHQSVFLGRDSLCQKLRHHIERVAQGQSGLLVLHGPRGVGKSRLLAQLADLRVSDQSPVALHAELYQHEDATPYRLFVRALRPALFKLSAHQLSQLLKELGDLAQPLTAIIPELQPALTAAAPTEEIYARVQEALLGALRLLTTRGPVLLVLDSLQWIDVNSLNLLDQLVRQRIPHLLIAAVYSAEDLQDGDGHPLLGMLRALEPWIDEKLEVPPLSPIDLHQVASVLAPDAPPDFGLWLYGETRGNPLHAEQLIQVYLQGPREARHPKQSAATRTLPDVVLRRLESLPGGVLTMLRQAAVLGQTFYLDHLCAALDRPETEVLDNLNAALQACLIRGHSSEDRYSFCHPLIREVVYAEMLPSLRKSYHWRAALVLERSATAGPLDATIDLVAHHFIHAAEHEGALVYLARAIRRARHLNAYEAALNYVDAALAVVAQLNQTAANENQREQRRKQREDLEAARQKLEEITAKGPASSNPSVTKLSTAPTPKEAG